VAVAVRITVDKFLVGEAPEDVAMTTSDDAIVVLTGTTMVSAGWVTTAVLETGTATDEDTMVIIPLSEAPENELATGTSETVWVMRWVSVTVGLPGAGALEMKVDAVAAVIRARVRILKEPIVDGCLLLGVGSGCRG
jgi:hypothetical protein